MEDAAIYHLILSSVILLNSEITLLVRYIQ
jgi:hypothetical protein